ncbi:flavin-containing monooxygenase 5 [Aplysia californica]|uniref:Flavin-containing monooxygenase n=1 Tax=Aplysia californica TaxID=6500 RepID=A0ABM0JQE4_APLCA|nr:flavin-containing monooxygenase 5 [Aplysia californica]
MAASAKKVAIIGAGASGITAIKCCLDEGLEPVCLERSEEVGGLWRYTDTPVEGQGCVMKSTVINTSKEMMAYSDYPIPEKCSNFMHNTEVFEYFKDYVEHFGLRKHIRFNTSVLSVKKTENFPVSGQWEVRSKDDKSGEEKTEVFDGVLVCSGHHADKYVPTFPGLSDFKGKVVHSHDYKVPDEFADKRVVIIGIGNSGGDIAVELSRRSKQVFLSTRRGTWILHRVAPQGKPLDMVALNRFVMFLIQTFPTLFGMILEYQLNQKIDHKLYSLRPSYGPAAQHPLVNDDMPNRIICGSIKIKTDIKRFTATGVEFVDGTSEEDIDAVILATGYSFGFPFIDKEVIDVQENRVQLFKYMYPPDLERPTLAVIGCFQPLGAIMPISEMQCRVATRVIKGEAFLPPKSEMWEDIRAKEAEMAKRYTKSRRHTIQVNYSPFMDELGEIIGCKPDLYQLFRHDPVLGFKVAFGPITPYQYRLKGPLAWKGARKAIMTQWDRVSAPLKTRPLPIPDSGTGNNRQLMMIGVLILLVFIFRYLFL